VTVLTSQGVEKVCLGEQVGGGSHMVGCVVV